MPWQELEKHSQSSTPQIYRAVIEGAPAMLWLGDPAGKCVFINRMLRDFWGVSLDDLATFDWTTTLHPDDVALLAAPFSVAMENRSAMQVEARYRRADGVYRILRTSAAPRFSDAGDFLGMVGVNTDVTEQRQGEEALKRTMRSLSLATRSSRLGWGTWDTGTGTAQWDDRAREILGLAPGDVTLEAWFRRIHPEDRGAVRCELETCAAAGRAFDLVFRVSHGSGPVLRVQGTGSLERTARGVKGTGLVRDVTEQAREEEFQQLVIRELGHRNKNLLALVNSLVSQTRTTGTAADYKAALQGRLAALAASVGVVADGSSCGADLHELCEAVLGPYLLERPDSIGISGPQASLPERYGRIVGLALHELMTNAVKYGALSCRGGRVHLGWDVTGTPGNGRLHLVWAEAGGPAVERPSGRGFGTRLLQDVIAMEPEARAILSFEPDGVRYSLDVQI